MKARKTKKDTMVHSIIGSKTVIRGDFKTEENTRIDGIIMGNVVAEGTIMIGESGHINGDIHATDAFIAGEIHGDLFVSGKIEAAATGKIYGNIKTKSLSIDENAVFQGKCEMNINDEQSQLKESTFVKDLLGKKDIISDESELVAMDDNEFNGLDETMNEVEDKVVVES